MRFPNGPRPGMSLEDRFWEKVNIPEDPNACHEWLGALSVDFGYGMFNNEGQTIKAHRFVWLLKHGSITDRCICHHCDNPKCVNVDHLFEGDLIDNNQDMVRKGRHGKMIFTHDKVRRLRAVYGRHKDHLSHRRIAEWFGVSRATISHLLRGRNWSNTEGEFQTGEGKRRYNQKLTAEQVREIRTRRENGEKLKSLALDFKVDETSISRICLFKTRSKV